MAPAQKSVDLAEADPGLARCLPAGMRLVAHAVKVPPGGFDPAELAHDAFALLVVAGVVRSEVSYAQRTVSETLITGDLLLPAVPRGDGFISRRVLSALSWCVFARLDVNFLTEATQTPALMAELTRRLADQEHRIAVSGAISQLPRADARIEATFEQLAARLGIPADGGVVVPLPMTHAAIGRMIGASRPTVSLALTRMAELGRLTRRPDGYWLLAHQTSG